MSKTDTVLSSIWTTPGKTQEGKPFDHSVRRQVDEGRWRLELIPAEVTGTARPMKVYRSIGRAQKKLAFFGGDVILDEVERPARRGVPGR